MKNNKKCKRVVMSDQTGIKFKRLFGDKDFQSRYKFWLGFLKNLTSREIATIIAIKEHQAIKDVLTGMLNLRGFIEYTQEFFRTLEFVGKNKNGLNYYLYYCDVDGLKRTNDSKNLGREAGNLLLIKIGKTLTKHNKEGITARVGGDEFCAFLIKKNEQEVYNFHKNFQESLIKLRKAKIIPKWSGASGGFIKIGNGKNIRSLLNKVDAAMKEAKNLKIRDSGQRGGHIPILVRFEKYE